MVKSSIKRLFVYLEKRICYILICQIGVAYY